MKIKNAIVGQSGGPTAAINATLAGVIAGVKETEGIGTLYGAFNGIEGVIADHVCDLGVQFRTSDDFELLKQTPASALGSCRLKLPDPGSTQSEATYDRIFEVLKKYDIGYFFYIGGNDSMDTVDKLESYGKMIGSDIAFIGIIKTIDNDLVLTDHTPGFGSAAKFIAATMQEILRDTAVYTVKAVTIVEIMGRDAGWLTASAALPGRICGVEPDLVYLPERIFDMERFFKDVEKAFQKRPNVVVAVSEGLKLANGHYVGEGSQKGVSDIFGHQYLAGTGKALEIAVKARFGCKVRSVELNLPQRCAAHFLSKTDIEEAFALGKATVTMRDFENRSGTLLVYERKDDPYFVSFTSKPVHEIANRTKYVPDTYINEEGNGVTPACLDYLLPLIRGEVDLICENGLPKHFLIKR